MSARSVNKVILIGNLTRDPELRYTPQGTPVASFGLATNREWVAEGVKKEAADFHNIVAWNKLAELCSQLLSKGTKIYVEGRLQTRDWVDNQGAKRYKTEVVIDEMIVLSSKKSNNQGDEEEELAHEESEGLNGGGSSEEINLDDVLSGDFDTDLDDDSKSE